MNYLELIFLHCIALGMFDKTYSWYSRGIYSWITICNDHKNVVYVYPVSVIHLPSKYLFIGKGKDMVQDLDMYLQVCVHMRSLQLVIVLFCYRHTLPEHVHFHPWRADITEPVSCNAVQGTIVHEWDIFKNHLHV